MNPVSVLGRSGIRRFDWALPPVALGRRSTARARAGGLGFRPGSISRPTNIAWEFEATPPQPHVRQQLEPRTDGAAEIHLIG